MLLAAVAVAAAQPAVDRTATAYVRTDAQAFYVFDTSRSMLAARAPTAPTRLARARALGLQVREALPDVPSGIASLTDRVLPHLFPTDTLAPFEATLDRSIGIEKPPPSSAAGGRATTLAALATLATQRFFAPRTQRRLAIVFTDGESQPFVRADLRRVFAGPLGVKALFVHVWRSGERVYSRRGTPEPDYAPDPSSGATLARLAAATGGYAFSEGERNAIVERARAVLGRGPEAALTTQRETRSLAPFALLAGVVPLGFILWRRNL
jgi:hypothetical protein